MKAAVESSSSEKSILSEERGQDIISYLPKEIRNHVVSFLSTKDAVKTSGISKRWQYMWTSLSEFVLTDWGDREILKQTICKADVLDFVDRVFTLHDPTDIKRFHLTLTYPVSYSRLDTWIRGAIEHNVQDLKLEVFPYNKGIAFPWCSFACHSMVTLKIIAQFPLQATETTLFSNLKTLHLCLITFSDELSVQHIFSGCLVLEELSLTSCKWNYVNYVTISIPTLRSLTIKDSAFSEDVVNCLQISAVNLTFLNCVRALHLNICFGEFPCLEHAVIGVQYRGKLKEEAPLRVSRLFTVVRNTESLEISDDTLLIFHELNGLLEKFGTFDRLTHLKVRSRCDSVCHYMIMEFLGKAPKLEHLHLSGGLYSDGSVVILEMVPPCFNHSLKIFSMSCFEGNPIQMEVLGFVLKNATVLLKVIICVWCYSPLSKEKEKLEAVRSQLNELPRVSKSCVIELHETSEIFA